MNKTIYLRDEEGPIWERARELAGDKLSPVIVTSLKHFIAIVEAQMAGFERIELAFEDADDHHLPKRKAFYGKWIFSRAAPYEYDEARFTDDGKEITDQCAVAITAKGSAVFFSWSEGPGTPYCFRLAIFPSLESAAAQRIYNGPARAAIEKIGVPIEELDI